MSLANIKRNIKVGTLLKLVRHDWLRPIVVNGNLGQTTIQPKITLDMVRPVRSVLSKGITLTTGSDYSILPWPKATSIRETANGFEIDLNQDGKFEAVMGYEFVKEGN